MSGVLKIVTQISSDPDAATQSLVGFGALAAELAVEGRFSQQAVCPHRGDGGRPGGRGCADIASSKACDLSECRTIGKTV